MPESKNSQRLTKSEKPRKTKKYKSAFLSATAIVVVMIKKAYFKGNLKQKLKIYNCFTTFD